MTHTVDYRLLSSPVAVAAPVCFLSFASPSPIPSARISAKERTSSSSGRLAEDTADVEADWVRHCDHGLESRILATCGTLWW